MKVKNRSFMAHDVRRYGTPIVMKIGVTKVSTKESKDDRYITIKKEEKKNFKHCFMDIDWRMLCHGIHG